MRLITSFDDGAQAERLSLHLKRRGIENNCEASLDFETGQRSYHLWVHDEDRISEAIEVSETFRKNPSLPEFDSPPPLPLSSEEISEEEIAPPQRQRTPLTVFFLTFCALLFLFNQISQIPMREEGLSEGSFLITPLQALFLFDLPPVIDKLEETIEKYEIPSDQKFSDLPPEVKSELQAVQKAPFWRGAYAWVLYKVRGEDPAQAEGDLFFRIRKGEIWRLFSPCLLHANMLHILFNMIWLWVLGRPIEQRIGPLRTLSLTLSTGIGSNIAQYLMSGPFFLGYSGVVMGLAGFTWMRERIAPWEGYPLQRSTLFFLLFFLGAMFLLQVASFFAQSVTSVRFELNIANTAHLTGAFLGALLGRLSFFSWRVGQ